MFKNAGYRPGFLELDNSTGDSQDATGMRSQPGIGNVLDKRKRPEKKIAETADADAVAKLKKAQREAVRNGGANAANLAVVENDVE